MEGNSSSNRHLLVKLTLAGLLILGNFLGNAVAGGYGSYGGYGGISGASASSSASASASSFSSGNAWQGEPQLGSGDHGRSGGFGGNPFLPSVAKGGSYDNNIGPSFINHHESNLNGLKDGLTGIKQGIVGLVGSVLGGVNTIHENIHGGGGCKTGNCGHKVLERPGLPGTHSGGDLGGNGGPSFGLGGAFAGASSGANAFGGTTGSFNSVHRHNKNCDASDCYRNGENILKPHQPAYHTKCSGPACREISDDITPLKQATNNILPGVLSTYIVHSFPSTPIHLPSPHHLPCMGLDCRQNPYDIKPLQTGSKIYSSQHPFHYPSTLKYPLPAHHIHRNPIEEKTNNSHAHSSDHENSHYKRSPRHSSFELQTEKNRKTHYSRTQRFPLPEHHLDKNLLEIESNRSPPRYLSSEHQIPCFDISCKENNADERRIKREEKNFPTTYLPNHRVSNHAATQQALLSAHSPPCNGPECGENKTNPIQSEETSFLTDDLPSFEELHYLRSLRYIHQRSDFSPSNEEFSHSSTPKDPSSTQRPPNGSLNNEEPHRPQCYGPACKKDNSGEISSDLESKVFQSHYSAIPEKRNHQPPGYSPSYVGSHNSRTPKCPSSTRRPPCNDPTCRENKSHNNPHELETSDFPPGYRKNYESPNYGSNSPYTSMTHHPSCYGPDCTKNKRDRNPHEPDSIAFQPDYSSIHEERDQHPSNYSTKREGHHSPSTSPNPALTTRPSCNGPACRENDSDKNTLELGRSNFPPGYSPKYEKTHYPSTPPSSSTAHRLPCYGPDCRETNRDKNSHEQYLSAVQPDYSSNHEERDPQPLYYSPNHYEHHYPSLQRYPSSTRRPPCNGPACTENNNDKNPLELGASNSPPDYLPNYEKPYYPSTSSYPSTAPRPPCHGPDCRENNRDKNSYEPDSGAFQSTYFSNHAERDHQPSNYSPNQNEHHYLKTPKYPPSTRRPPCNGPACTENNNDKNPLELGTSNFPPGHSANSKKTHYPSTSPHPSSIHRPPCYGSDCRENSREKKPYEPETSVFQSKYSPDHEERNHQSPVYSPNRQEHHYQSTPTYLTSTSHPPCNGPACRENNSDKNPLELGTSNFPPGYSPNYEDSHYPSTPIHSSSQHPLSHDPECNENNNNVNPLESGTSNLTPAYPPKHGIPSISTHQPACNTPTCSDRNINRNPFISGTNYFPSKSEEHSQESWQPASNPQIGSGNWHPVFNPNPVCTGPNCGGNKRTNTGCSGSHCGGGNYESASYIAPTYDTKDHPNTDCALPDCNPYSSTGCPGPYCDGPEYSKPACSGPNCARKHSLKPVCSGPNCGGNSFSSTGCPGPYCDGPEYSKPCTGSKCSGGQHSSGEGHACTGPFCEGDRQPNLSYPNSNQHTDCTGLTCNGVIKVISQKPSAYRPSSSGCTNGNCQPKRPHSGPKSPIVYSQEDSDRYIWPSFPNPGPELNKEIPYNGETGGYGYGGRKGGCTTGTCSGSEDDFIGSGALSSASASSSNSANAGSGGNLSSGHSGNGAENGPSSYGHTFSNSFSSAYASASASAHSGSYGR